MKKGDIVTFNVPYPQELPQWPIESPHGEVIELHPHDGSVLVSYTSKGEEVDFWFDPQEITVLGAAK